MTLEQLRLRHPKLTYRSYDLARGNDRLVIRHHLELDPDIHFYPVTTIPVLETGDVRELEPYVFHLGLIEAISYWKAACPKELVIEAGDLTSDQIRFLYDLIIHGLGEFFYRNNIDFTAPEFLHITAKALNNNAAHDSQVNKVQHKNPLKQEVISDLIMVGGGKDSAVALGTMKQTGTGARTIVVNPTEAALENVRVAGFTAPIEVSRSIDPNLLALNKKGYLNGHTPFSAYLAFLGLLVAKASDLDCVIVSNEKSANEGSVVYRGIEVNHQYSKSYQFEQEFRSYVSENFDDAPSYFSFLRPLNDVQISKLFAGFPEFYPTFRSCNVASKTNSWCGACAKCAFTYLTLFPFITYDNMMKIFGRDYFADPIIISYLKELTGLTAMKPFECVGTADESKAAVYLAKNSYERDKREIPEGLLRLVSDLALTENDVSRLMRDVVETWGDTFNLPPEHLTLLRAAWRRANPY